MDRRLFSVLICTLIFVSCAVDKTGFIVRHKKKNITLNPISDQPKIGYETDYAIIYFSQTEAIKQTERLLSSKKLNPRFDYQLINDLKTNIDYLKRIQTETLVRHWQNQKDSIDLKSYDFAGFIDQWILKDLIMKGKTEIWNKSTKQFEERITYHFVKDQLGGQDCYYTFQNGSEFHRQLIALGE